MRPPVALAMLLIPAGMSADTDTSRLFRDTVFPTLRKECVGCHGEGQTLGKLDLRTRAAMLAGGARGPAILPGKASESLLVAAIEGKTAFAMPPGGESKRLNPETIAAFRAWIDGGAPWGAGKQESWTYSEADVWAFRPLRKVSPPEGSANPIDAFLLARLREKGLEPAPFADRRTLIRRITFDLTGLPPTPEEVDAFVSDPSEDAWPKLVERLLASPRYGERWGGHWLDVTRYADSSGYSNDFERPNAWRYRDYVIRSFNADKPYDQFVREQIAGDELYPGNADAIIATGFLRAGPWEHTSMSVEAVTRQMWLDDVTAAVGTTFLGLTTGCARCHDHKFDPIPTKDYYQLQAIFASTEFARPKAPFLNSESTAGSEREKARLRQSIERTQARIDGYRRLAAERSAKRGGSTSSDLAVAAMQSMKELTPEEFEEFKLHQKHLQVYREALTRFDPLAFAVSSGPLDGATDGGPALKYPKAADYKPAEVRILVGGNLQSPAESVAPGFLSAVAHYAKFAPERVPTSIAGRRSALAAWITDPRNPLSARVMVNRIWQYHFGAALTPDANNLGKTGGKPSHPELLDWLAQRFVAGGWSVKSMHRLILLSDAYRRSSSHPTMKQVRTADPSNSLLAHFPARRIDADELRDSILFVAGELSPDAGGPGGYPQINDDVARQPRHAMGSLQPAYHPSPEKRIRNRRAIYSFRQRGLMDPFLEVFNEPNPDVSCPRRESSTVPTQAFALLNSQFAHDMALAFAARVAKAGGDRERQVRGLFGLAYGRDPSEAELQDALAHWDRMTALHHRAPPPPKAAPKPIVHMITSELTGEQFQFRQDDSPEGFEPNLHPSDVSPELRALADVALGLLNSNEFVYVY